MSWKDRLIRPRWEHKDPEIRARAVAELNDSKLKAKLPELAVEDPDPRVRLQALLRLDHEELWFRFAWEDSDETIRNEAAKRIPRLILGAGKDDGLSELRMQWVARSGDREFLQRVAVQSPLPNLRRAALERISAQGFLGDRVVDEPDDALARLALEGLSQPSTLQRIADRLRKKNKRRHHWVLEKLAGPTPATEGTRAADQRYQQIVRELELLARGEHAGDPRQQLQILESQWAQLPETPDETLKRRFQGARSIVEASLVERPRPVAEPPEARLQRLLESTDKNRIVSEAEAIRTELGESLSPAVQAALEQIDLHLAGLDSQPHKTLAEVAGRVSRLVEQASKPPREEMVRELTSAWDRAWSGLDQPTGGDEALKEKVLAQLAGLRDQAAAPPPAKPSADARPQASRKQADLLMDRAEAALDDGELKPAQQAINQARSETDRLPGKMAAGLRGRLNQLSGRLKEMRDWQHWSNNKIRRRLIGEVEALPEAGLHPDAITARLREVREQWQALDKQEHLPGDRRQFSAPAAEWQRFQSACRKAHEAARPFFEKRSAIQQARLEEMAEFVEQGKAAADDPATPQSTIDKLLNEARRIIRQVGDVPPDQRGRTAGMLKSLMDDLNRRQDAHADEVERLKLQLIREAENLVHENDPAQATEAAKALQARWQKIGGSRRRKREQELWKAFREPIDPLFEKVASERKDRAEAEARLRAELTALCEEAERLAEVPDDELDSATGPMAGLAEQLGQAAVPELRKRFASAESKLARRLEEQARSRAEAHLQQQAEIADLLQQAWQLRTGGLPGTRVEKLRQAFGDNPEAGSNPETKVLFEALLDPDSDQTELERTVSEHTDSARQVLVELEFLAGIPSPEEDRKRRMDYQVQRLSAHLGGAAGTGKAVTEEAETLRLRWLASFPVDDQSYESFKKRYQQSLSALEENPNPQ